MDQSEPFLATLVSPDTEDAGADIAALMALSAATNTRLQAQADVSGLAIGAYELVYDLDYSKFINGAFTYPGQGARFHDESRGAWYAGLEVETSLAEVAHHKWQSLLEISVFEEAVEYQGFVCDIGGDHFADLRDGSADSARCLKPDSYAASQALAASLLAQGAAGVVWPSVRRSGGTCVVCFRPSLLPPVRKGSRWRLEWSGAPTPDISELP